VADPAEAGQARRPTAGRTLRVRPATGADRAAWDALVLASPRGTPFHLEAWRDAVRRSFPFTSLDLVAEDGEGRLRGAFPLWEVKNPFRRRFLLSAPFAVYGGIVAEDSAAERALLAEAERLARSRGAAFVEIRSRDPVDYGFNRKDLYVTFLRDLPRSPDDCPAMLPRKARAAARQASERHGLVAEMGRSAFDEFFDLFVVNKRDLGSPPLPKRFLAALLDSFGPGADVLTVRKDGRAIAAVMTFFFRDTVVPYYSGSLARTGPLHPNNFMYLKLMEEGVKRGMARFDFGRSRRETGAFDFKKNQGFEPTPLHYQYLLLDEGPVPDVHPGNPRFALAAAAWKRLPAPVARVFGAAISRYFP